MVRCSRKDRSRTLVLINQPPPHRRFTKEPHPMFRTTLKKSVLGLVAVAATAAAISPAAASAATVTQSGGTLYVDARSGETNDMTVTMTDTYLQIHDNNSGGVQPQAGTSCALYTPG